MTQGRHKQDGLSDGVHRTRVRVRFGDTDPYGIVYFVSYFRYCHGGIEEYLRACGLKPEETFKNLREGYGLPIVEAWCCFRRPVRYGELLRLETRVPGDQVQGHDLRVRILSRDRSGVAGGRLRPPGGH